tara:strand:+ start:1206 stop:1793 length:588 start_codon:yes stop_codon:yes gene_type:complete
MMNEKDKHSKLPRGIRNNNPGNIRHSKDVWQGQSKTQTDSAFVQFNDPVYGLRALMKLVLNYQRKYGLNSVKKIIDRWAPPVENNTDAYITNVAQHMGVKPTTPIDLEDHTTLIRLAKHITLHENGKPQNHDSTHAYWYQEQLYLQASELALGKPVPARKITVDHIEIVEPKTIKCPFLRLLNTIKNSFTSGRNI